MPFVSNTEFHSPFELSSTILFTFNCVSILMASLTCVHFYNSDSGFVPIFIYAIFGSSRQLAIGPVALTSLLVSNVLGNIVDSSEKLYTELAILLALMVGVLECIMGLLRCRF